MTKEYFFSPTSKLECELDDDFDTFAENKSIRYLVSNVRSTNAEIYAPEINFYFEKSEDEIREKMQNIKRLYDVRSTVFDYGQDIELSTEVGQRALIVSNETQSDLSEELGAYGFTSKFIDPIHVKEVHGCIGKLRVTAEIDGKIGVLEADQIIWFGAPRSIMGRRGIYDPEVLGRNKTVEEVQSNSGIYSFKNSIKYNHSLCQYHHRRQEVCGRCADICPTIGISRNSTDKQLEISDIDCIGCGRCVSVCPAGALDYAQIPRASFTTLCSFYKKRIALILSNGIDLEKFRIRLQKNVLPLVVETLEFLDECHFLSLLQTTGHPIILYTENVSGVMENSIRIINEIFEKKYARQAIFICRDEIELNKVFAHVSPIQDSMYELDEDGLNKREIFSARLSHVVEESDIGIITTGPHIHYGNLAINQLCTLCLSCADACGIGALTAHPEDNTLRFNPSLCTSCGYCEITCPEQNCLSIVHDQLSLHPDYFKSRVVAQDELFKCVECGKGFAPAKSIEKIAAIMKPLFGSDATKIKTLSCCPDCKARVMLEAQRIDNITGEDG